MIFDTKYQRELAKILKLHKLTQEQVDETIAAFNEDKTDHRLRLHNINCKHDTQRKSISVINTAYRILYTLKDEETVFVRIVDHDTYDRLNKDC